ncbi:hypothetical protein PPL_12141 [Heterostelium album PN500]|uniref:Uncharacterized protein n=1 Tax=Heterostelium pallidum (strain ATCC 26659 / Pp 5 / PN500) TaxID=670386 RepID=D3BLT7_HETP5|nr:hypothetical protein PPL_12141 [Heterostelium album PN500]EFA77538.1 hypothetical protein PPL_12141 [Heterostelium album PN500]|eukprot:XP_020429666.1 hypothetical protein PPL_12141 [Heterostelium album PN500]
MEYFGVVNEDTREKYRTVLQGLAKFSRNIWLALDQEAIVLGTQFFVYFVIFDDLIDTNEQEFCIIIIKRAINIFKLGKLEANATPLEKLAFYFLRIVKDRVGDQHPLMNLFITSCIEYFENLVPWQSIKELREKDERMNSFHFMKTQNNWSNQECFDFIEKELDICFEEYFTDENLLIQKFIPNLKNKEDQEEFYQILQQFHTLVSALVSMYLERVKYKSPDSIFLELRKFFVFRHSGGHSQVGLDALALNHEELIVL